MNRRQWQQKLFPGGIPKLWCPTLTHFVEPGKFDQQQIQQHLSSLSPHVKGILVPGSTGEGWEMSDQQIANLLDLVLPMAHANGIHVLIGILKTSTREVLEAIDQLDQQLAQPATVGITVCPPKGQSLKQLELQDAMRQVLRLGIPTAVYQLPQVTQNELAAEVVAQLASEFDNFILFKDTSGADRVAYDEADLQGVFMLRGSEQQGYAKWLKSAGGRYDGFLLSTANVFASELITIIDHCEQGRQESAEQLSNELQKIVSRAFELAGSFADGNAFTNANKLIHHLKRHRSAYAQFPPPMLLKGARLPMEWLDNLAHQFPQLIK